MNDFEQRGDNLGVLLLLAICLYFGLEQQCLVTLLETDFRNIQTCPLVTPNTLHSSCDQETCMSSLFLFRRAYSDGSAWSLCTVEDSQDIAGFKISEIG